MPSPDLELAIGRAVNKVCPIGSGVDFKIDKVARVILSENTNLARRLGNVALLPFLKQATRAWLKGLSRRVTLISGQVEAVPVFMHHPDGKRGDRWLRTSTMTKVQLGNKIAMLRRQQHGYDIRLRVYETIYDLLPFEDAIVGSVIRIMRGDAVSTRRPD